MRRCLISGKCGDWAVIGGLTGGQDEPVHAWMVPAAAGEGRWRCAVGVGGPGAVAGTGQQVPARPTGRELPWAAGVPRASEGVMPEGPGAGRGGDEREGAAEGREAAGRDGPSGRWDLRGEPARPCLAREFIMQYIRLRLCGSSKIFIYVPGCRSRT